MARSGKSRNDEVEKISADQLADAMRAFQQTLRSHRDEINRLNVYPVPDGDTGSNMSMTLDAVVDELPAEDKENSQTVNEAMSHGSLMGARGNSGVILSQLLRGFSEVAKEKTEMSPTDFADALIAASEAAYKAVLKPVEGTVLSVAREAAEAAKEKAITGAPLLDVIEHAAQRAQEALDDTPNHLDALKRAGVVDAGGKGFTLFFDALLNALDERPLPEPEEVRDAAGEMHSQPAHDGESDEFRYEVMFFLEDARDASIESFKVAWSAIGDSIVVVGGDGLYNCHIHSNDIGGSIEAALTVGRPRNIRVTDLHEQIHQGPTHVSQDVSQGLTPQAKQPVETAVIAVASGDGVIKLLQSLGVQEIVEGGQTMNPSTAELLAAVEAAPAKNVIVLPNNKNIIPVAQQLDSLTDKTVSVVPTRAVPEGLGALFSYDADASIDANSNAMAEGAERVIAGEITQAIRDSEAEIGGVAKGDFIGVCRDGLLSKGDSLQEATLGLLNAVVRDDHEVVTLYIGDGTSESAVLVVADAVTTKYPDLTVEVQYGGQSLYPLLIGVE
jgi:DAK2 domain fusion protein YloV